MCNRDLTAHRARNIYYLALYRKRRLPRILPRFCSPTAFLASWEMQNEGTDQTAENFPFLPPRLSAIHHKPFKAKAQKVKWFLLCFREARSGAMGEWMSSHTKKKEWSCSLSHYPFLISFLESQGINFPCSCMPGLVGLLFYEIRGEKRPPYESGLLVSSDKIPIQGDYSNEENLLAHVTKKSGICSCFRHSWIQGVKIAPSGLIPSVSSVLVWISGRCSRHEARWQQGPRSPLLASPSRKMCCP